MDRQTRLYVVYALTTFFFTIFFLSGIYFDIPSPNKYFETKIVYQTVTKYINSTIELPVGQIYEKNVTVYGIAVFNETGSGELAKISMFLKPGYGGILLDVSGRTFGTDLQESLPLVRSYAESFTGVSLAYKDVIVGVETTAENIAGSSGGAAMAVGLISMLQNTKLKNDTVVTGVLQPDGTLSSVNSLNLKISVAKNLGVREILIPKVECSSVNESIIGITVTCVNSVREALKYMTA
jgi:predicted S18 family serine protease